MSGLVTTVEGWRATVLSIRWSPLLVTPAASCLALIAVAVLGESGPGGMALVGDAGLAFTAVTAAFVADDASNEAAPATPIEAPVRLAARAAIAVPVAVTGWVLVLAVYDSLTPTPVAADVGSRAVAALALGSAGLALAALGGLGSAASPGAVGVGVTAGLGVAWHALPSGWLEALPPTKVLGPTTIVVAVLTVAIVTQEPRR